MYDLVDPVEVKKKCSKLLQGYFCPGLEILFLFNGIRWSLLYYLDQQFALLNEIEHKKFEKGQIS